MLIYNFIRNFSCWVGNLFLSAIIATLLISPNGFALAKETSNCVTNHTNWAEYGNGGPQYLDRHKVICKEMFAISSLQFEKKLGMLRYSYKCCRFAFDQNKNNFDCGRSHQRFTNFTLENQANASVLALHNINCNMHYMTMFKLHRSIGKSQLRYKFSCCRSKNETFIRCQDKETLFVPSGNVSILYMMSLKLECQHDNFLSSFQLQLMQKSKSPCWSYKYTCCKEVVDVSSSFALSLSTAAFTPNPLSTIKMQSPIASQMSTRMLLESSALPLSNTSVGIAGLRTSFIPPSAMAISTTPIHKGKVSQSTSILTVATLNSSTISLSKLSTSGLTQLKSLSSIAQPVSSSTLQKYFITTTSRFRSPTIIIPSTNTSTAVATTWISFTVFPTKMITPTAADTSIPIHFQTQTADKQNMSYNLKVLNSTIVCFSIIPKTSCSSVPNIADSLFNIVSKSTVKMLSLQDLMYIASILDKIGTHVQVSANELSIMKKILQVIEVIYDPIQYYSSMTNDFVIGKIELVKQAIVKNLEFIGVAVAESLDLDKVISISNKYICFAAGKLFPLEGDITISAKTPKQNSNEIQCGINNNATGIIMEMLDEETTLAVMVVPSNVFKISNLRNHSLSLCSFTYTNSIFFHDIRHRKTGSSVLSATFSNSQQLQTLFQIPIDIIFKRTKWYSKEPADVSCGFWEENKRRWSTDGVCKVDSEYTSETTDFVSCQTTHLTNFALLLDVSQTSANPKALQMVTWIGCTISLVALSLTVMSILMNRNLRQKLAQKLMLCLCLSLECTMLVFVFGVEKAKHTTTLNCQIVAALLHYFLLETFFWMFVHAIHLYRSFVKIFQLDADSPGRFLGRAFLFSTGTPAIIVAFCFWAREGKDYGNEIFCIVQGRIFYIAVLLPVSMVLLANTIIFSAVIISITTNKPTWVSSKSPQRLTDNKATYEKHCKNLKIALAFTVLLGLTWVFGVLAVGSFREVFQYLFCIFNSLQGFFIFLFFTLLNRDFLKGLKILKK